jgi:hypothetical protein
MIRNEICCDICGFKVADIRKGLLRNKIIVYRSYAEFPSVLLNGKRPKVHICSNCMKDYVYKAFDEKKEQSK